MNRKKRQTPTAAKYFPSDVDNPLILADWLEIVALTSPDGDAGAGDLERPLRRLGNTTPDPLIGRVFTEIDRRIAATGKAYPFKRGNNYISLRANAAKRFSPYIFCLLISFFKWKAKKNAPQNPWLLFEELAHVAAGEFFDARKTTLLFGTSARSKIKNFGQAVDNLCRLLNEGDSFAAQATDAKDDKVDVVVWKPFPDRLGSQLVMFGQCAAGDDWPKKISHLQPEAFSTQWLNNPLISPVIRSFYIPHRIRPEQWEYVARRAGVVFDRCRIAHFAHRRAGYFSKDTKFFDCCNMVSPIPLN